MDIYVNKVISENTELNYTEFLVFLALDENPNMTQDEISKWANFTKSTASKTIDKLVNKKFLDRKENPIDRRQKDLRITKDGQSQFETAKNLVQKASTDLFSVLDTCDSQKLGEFLDKIISQGVPKMYDSNIKPE